MQPKTVLIVEDDVLVSLMLEELLVEAGFRVAAMYRSAIAALAHMKQQTPDVLLIDILLQGNQSGVDLARSVREFWAGPVVFYTSASNAVPQDQITAIPNSVVVLKQAASTELIRAIRTLLDADRRL